MFGITPAFGLYIRHAAGIEISDLKVLADSRDARPCIVADDVDGLDVANLKLNQKAAPTLVLNNVKDFRVSRSAAVPDTQIADAKRREL